MKNPFLHYLFIPVLINYCLFSVKNFPSVYSHPCRIISQENYLTAICQNLHLFSVPQDMDRYLKILIMENNQIEDLGDNQFKVYGQLQEIYLGGNYIVDVKLDAFRGVDNLQILDMSRNGLKTIPHMGLRLVSKLRQLILSGNPIQGLQSNDLIGLEKLEKLDLSNCRITTIAWNFHHNSLSYLHELNLESNQLSWLNSKWKLPKNLKVIRLFGNKWNCNCHLRWLIKHLLFSRPTVSWSFGRRVPSCWQPDLLSGIKWSELKPEQFVCSPIIYQHSKNNLIKSDYETAVFYCSSSGDPQPEIAWFRNGSRILDKHSANCVTNLSRIIVVPNSSGGEEKTENIYDYNSSLTVRNISALDAGFYKCVAKNAAGRSEVSFTLTYTKSITRLSSNEQTLSRWALLSACLGCLFILLIGSIPILVTCRVLFVRRRRRKDEMKRITCTLKGNNFPSSSINVEAIKMTNNCLQFAPTLETKQPDLLIKDNHQRSKQLDGAVGVFHFNELEIYAGTSV